MKTAFILGLIAIVGNILLVLYFKKRGRKINKDSLTNILKHSNAHQGENICSKDVLSLIEQSSKELDISAKELMHMSAEQIEQLAKEKRLSSISETYQTESAAISVSREDQQEDKLKTDEE